MQCPFSDIPAKDVKPEAKCEGTLDKPKLRDILQNRPIIFPNISVIKIKQQIRNCYKLEESNEI